MINNTIFIKSVYIDTLYYRKLNSKQFENAICECLSKKYNVLYCIESANNCYYGAKMKTETIHFKTINNVFTVLIDIENIETYLNVFNNKNKLLYLYGQSRHVKNFNNQMKNLINDTRYYIIFETKFENMLINYNSFPYDIVITSNIYNYDLSMRWLSNIKCLQATLINIQYFIIGDYDPNLDLNDEDIYVANNDNKNYNFVISNITNLKNMKNKNVLTLNNIFLIKIK